jgi:hypothetical protein
MQGDTAGSGAPEGAAHTAATLRDGLLQDLIAVSMMLKDVERSLSPDDEPGPLLKRAAITLEDDLAHLRQLIRALEEIGHCTRDHLLP